jgi:hypothetical protein
MPKYLYSAEEKMSQNQTDECAAYNSQYISSFRRIDIAYPPE